MNFRSAFTILFLGIIVFASCGKKEADEPVFAFEFAKGDSIVYTYSQTLIEKETMDTVLVNRTIEGEGLIKLLSQSDTLADLNIADLKIKVIQGTKDTMDTHEFDVPNMTIPNMTKGGGFEDANTHPLYRILFPVTGQQIAVNQTINQEVVVPVNVFGSIFDCPGTLATTRLEVGEWKGEPCEVLESKFKWNLANVNSGGLTNDEYDLHGQGTYYYSTKTKRMLAADIVFQSTIGVSATGTDKAGSVNRKINSSSTYHYELR